MLKTHGRIPAHAWLSLVGLCLLLLLAACGGSTTTASTPTSTPTTAPTTAPTPTPTTVPTPTPTTAPASNGNSVTIANFSFSPAAITVKVGTKITWTNKDSVAHTVTADQGAFNSGPLAPGSSFSFTFKKAGTYSYHCSIHPSMTASIVVQ